ncbi:MAG: cation diffusion facilitator family transporter [Nitrospirales bacterium]|nr:cation diffusion facilitator family transporter [Nitrospirales bacterium]
MTVTATPNAMGGGGKGVAILSLGLNALLTAAKFGLYLLTGSSALLAETVHSLTDVVGSLLLIGGILLAEKKSKEFPWGLYKVENFAALLSSVLIFISAFEVAKAAYAVSGDIRSPDTAILALLAMAVPVLLFAEYEERKAKALNSPALMADARNWRLDLAPLVVVAAGLAGSWLSSPVIDKAAAAVILVLVLKSGYGIMKDSMKSLLDASVDKETLARIITVVREFPQVRDLLSIHARNSGRFIFVSMTLSLSAKRLSDAHGITEEIEKHVREAIPFVERVVIHYEPERKDRIRYAAPLQNRDGEISEHFGSAPFLAVWDNSAEDSSLLSLDIQENPGAEAGKAKGIGLAEFLATLGVDVLFVKKRPEGKGPVHALSDAGIEMRQESANTLEELIFLKPEKIHAGSNGIFHK